MKNVKDIFPINLQLFGEENGADSGASGSENAAQGAQEAAEQPRTYTEEELQAAIDSRQAHSNTGNNLLNRFILLSFRWLFYWGFFYFQQGVLSPVRDFRPAYRRG